MAQQQFGSRLLSAGDGSDLNHLLFAITALVLLAACEGMSLPPGPSLPPEGTVTVRQPITASAATAELGEDCTVHGASICKSNLCVQFKERGKIGAFACTARCLDDTECPLNFHCEHLAPTVERGACIPDADWVPQRTAVRPPRTQLLVMGAVGSADAGVLDNKANDSDTRVGGAGGSSP